MNDRPGPVPFVPLSRGMIDGSLWEADLRVRVLFVTMLFISFEPARRGTVDVTLRKLAGRAGMSPKDVRYALDVLMSPDPDSRTKDDDGRRVERIDERRDWGWRIVNWTGYEDARERMLNAARQARFKARGSGAGNAPVTRGNGAVTPGNLEGEVEVEVEVEGEKREARGSAPRAPLPPSGLVATWESERGALPAVRGLSKARERKARLRLQEVPDLQRWAAAFRKAAGSPFCLGENDRGWRASFDWFLQPDTLLKVEEGKYDRAPRNGRPVAALVGAHSNPKPVRDISTASPEIQDIARRIAMREDTTEAEDDAYADWLNGGAA